MKRKFKKTLSSLEHKRLIQITLVFLVVAFIWLLFAPGVGLVSLYKEKAQLKDIQNQRITLEKENSVLRLEIDRIHNDIDYFEYQARKKHGLIKENEIIFDFSRDETQ